MALGTGALSDAILVSQADTSITLALRPLGAEANCAGKRVRRISRWRRAAGNGVQLYSQTRWTTL